MNVFRGANIYTKMVLTMSDREKLIEILSIPIFPHLDADPAEVVADYLIDNGVMVQKQGRWKQARHTEAPLYICSKCDKSEYKQHNYCPNCGAKMDKECE